MKDLVSNKETDVVIAKKLGLTEDEFKSIVTILGRTPNFTELSVFSVMWSEHCSYKNSIKYLKTLPRSGSNLLVEAGEENAGLVDIGQGLACAFKIESHNHPSAIEPYQGAATGVGGIHRDIFTMGARPIAALNSLRFGDLARPHTQHLVKGVVKGIGDYGNCLGVPTIGGETYFNNCYNQNILVNAMSIGTVKVGETVSATADGVGNPVYIVGSATGKDGIHGATFASADLTEDSADDLPAVQVGDPFQEKLLLEASLEAIQTGAIVGMQDMGAAGICCSSSEMSAKSGTGMNINLDKVPTRQADMEPFEILLSESQERMLIVCHKGKEAALEAVFDKWDLECEIIGEVTDTKRLVMTFRGETVVDVPSNELVLGGGAPVYDREYKEAAYYKKLNAFDMTQIAEPTDYLATAKKLMTSNNLASKAWISEQYDSMVRTNSMHSNMPSDGHSIRIKGTEKAIVAAVDCNSSFVYADPYIGAMIAVSEAARNIACTGGKPLAVTNCLNFGNPYNPEVYWQFVNVIKGMGEACKAFDTPVTGGNVSFYNQTQINDTVIPVYPTPTIGMIGLLEDLDNQTGLGFKKPGDVIIQLGVTQNEINQSEYLRFIHEVTESPVPSFNLQDEQHLQNAILDCIYAKTVQSAHDISDGGLFMNLIESSMVNRLGFELTTDPSIRKDAFLFGESQSRIVISCSEDQVSKINTICEKHNVTTAIIGKVTDGSIQVDEDQYSDINDFINIFKNQLPSILNN